MKNYTGLVFILFIVNGLTARDITVCKTCSVKKIQQAVNLAVNGDRIFIRNGEYKENDINIVNKSIQIIGQGFPIINGEFKQTIFKINANSVSIKGLKIINVGQSYTKDFAAILLNRCENFKIERNIFKNVFFGILIEKSKNGEVAHNTISSNATEESSSGNGIHVWHCSNLIIHDNKLTGLRDGIYFEFVDNSKIYNNSSHDNIRYGLHFMFSNNDEYYNNLFENNGAGVAVMFSSFINMHDNVFRFNWGTVSYGLLLKEIYDAEIHQNTFEENTIGINVEGSTRINYTNNTFIRNGWAAKLKGACYENIFEKNDFVYNSFDLAYDSRINDNKFDGNHWSEYTGYDLDKNGVGDVAYRPVKLFSYVVNRTPEALVLLRSLFVDIINFSEKVSPAFTPDDLMDNEPAMNRIND